MSDKPLPPDLRFLLEAERARPDAPLAAKAATEDRLAALLGPAAGLSTGAGLSALRPAARAASVTGASAVPVTKLLAVFAVGGLVGGGAATTLLRPEPRIVYVERPAAAVSAAPSPTPVLSHEAASSPGDSAPAAAAAPAPAPMASPLPATSVGVRSRDTDLATERAVIERARSALARGDGPGALLAIAQHQREFARGQLVEEREALAVQALAIAGRAEEATARAARFRKSFPHSLLLPLVEQAVR